MKLRTRLTVLLMAFAFLPLVIGICVVASIGISSEKALMTNYLNEYNNVAAQQLESLFESRASLLATYAQLDSVRNYDWETAKEIFQLSVDDGTVEKIILAHADGTYYTTGAGNPYFGGHATSDNKSPDATLSNISARDYFQYLVVKNPQGVPRSTIADPVISLSNNTIQVMVAHTVSDPDGKLAGIIAGSVSWNLLEKSLSDLSKTLHEKFGSDSRMMVVSNSGAYVYHWDSSKAVHIDKEKNVAVTPSIYDKEDSALLDISAPMLLGNSGSADYTDPKTGIKYLYLYQPIPGTNFSMCLFLPQTAIYKTLQTQVSYSFIVGGLFLVIGFIVSIFFGKQIVSPLQQIADTLSQIAAGGGDLTRRLPVRGNDVVSEISKNFNSFTDTLAHLLGEVREEAGQLDVVSDELAGNIGHTHQAVGNIAGNVNVLADNSSTLTTSVDTTSSAVHQIVRNIESMNGQIAVQSRSVSESAAAIEEMVGNIQSVSTNLTRSTKTFNSLKDDSDNGRNIMEAVIEAVRATGQLSQELLETNEVLGTITSQTNMLAMNAAIEAAHAGEAGKGFSVVADEIRKLAEDSSDQSKKIEEVLIATVENIQKVVDESQQANDAFETISNQIQAVDGLIHEVTAAMSEQAEGSQQVLESLRKMQDITSEIQSGSNEMTSGAELIQQEMDRLNKVAVIVRDNASEMRSDVDSITQSVNSVSDLAQTNKNLGTSLSAKTNGFTL